MNDRQYRHHSLVSRLITGERVLTIVVLGVVLGLFGWGYVTAAHHVGQILNDTVAHVRQ